MIPERHTYTVVGDESDLRLDQFLSLKESLSRSFIQKLIKDGLAKVNGKPGKRSYRIKENDEIEIVIPETETHEPLPEQIPLNVIYEDDALFVLNKPAGMVVHPAAGINSGTLVNALLARYPNLAPVGDVQRPGIVHRLDKDTSGVLVVAKTAQAHQNLSAQFKEHLVKKEYLAVVCGIPAKDVGNIIAPIGRSSRNRKKMAVTAVSGREAITNFTVSERYNGFALLSVFPETGRTHQIRVHLTYIGHPVVGDETYGGGRRRAIKEARSPKLKSAIAKLNRHLLHAQTLRFYHPVTEEFVEFAAPIPPEIQNILKVLKRG